MKAIYISAMLCLCYGSLFAQSQVITTGNNVIDTQNPYAADIVIGSDQGTRHDSSIMWWSSASASRISNTFDVFKFSTWSSADPNIALAATLGASSYFLGNLGIGTNTPNERLVVNGNIKVILDAGIFPQKNVVGIVSLGYSGITGARNWSLRSVYQYGDGVGQNADGGDLDVIKSLDGNIILGTKTDGTSLANIGIGTTSPKEKLSVMGKIRAQEIKVEMSGWPDYVFSKEYPLESLSKLRDYISVNHHLPNIPSAAETAENGIMVGDMTKRLLSKIEELTLYIINQDENIQKLVKENSDLKQSQSDQLILLKELKLEMEKFKLLSSFKNIQK